MVNDNEQWVCHTTLLQLDCPSGGHWDYAGIFAVEVRFQIKDQVWIPQPELDETKFILDFFVKPVRAQVNFLVLKSEEYYKRDFSSLIRLSNKKNDVLY